MKKKLLILSFLFVAVAAITTYGITNNSSSRNHLLANIEALTEDECYSGGGGSSSCSIDGGIEIAGVGVSVACSVGCNSGYYACCTLTGCDCVKE